MRGRGWWIAAGLAFALWLAAAAPLLLGQRTLFLRDVFSNHFPNKAFGAEELRHGHVPAFNPALGLGLPFRGNAALAPFYPGNLLYLILPLWSAFNGHYALHWLLAAVTMAALARALGMGPWGTLFASVTYAGSGWVLSCLSFYNLIGFAAWWPLAIAGAVRGGRRGVAVGGLAAGLALLAGEPVTWTLALLPLTAAAIERHGLRRGASLAAAIAAFGVLLALPQVVATARLLPFSLRGWRGVSPAEATQYGLHPLRWIELLLPLPFGWPGWSGPHGWWAVGVAPRVPYYFSFYPGVIAAWLGMRAATRGPGRLWAGVSLLGLFTPWAAGLLSPLMANVTSGLFRFPEKFLVWFALALPLAAGFAVERLGARPDAALESRSEVQPRRVGGVALPIAAVLLLLGVVAWLARPAVAEAMTAAGANALRANVSAIAFTQLAWLGAGLAGAGLLLAVAVLAVRRELPALLVVAQIAALAQLWPLVASDDAAPYREAPEWIASLRPQQEAARAVGLARLAVVPSMTVGLGGGQIAVPFGRMTTFERLQSAHLGPTPGVLHALSYPLQPDSEGLGSSLHTFWTVNLSEIKRDTDVLRSWMRVVGVRAMVLLDDPSRFGLGTIAQRLDPAGPAWLAAVPDAAPGAFWPRRVEVAASPVAALHAVERIEDPADLAVLSEAVPRHGNGRARLVSEHADRLVLETEGEGGLVVVQRAYHPLYEARSEGERLRTQPVDLILLGVEVPPGPRRVELSVSARPEAVAGVLSLLAAVTTAMALQSTRK